MKRFVIALAAVPLMCSAAFADIVILPKECLEVVSSEFSTGNGDSAFFQLEVMCRTGEQSWSIYTAEKGSVAGLFGMGRISQPKEIRITIGKHSGAVEWRD